MHKYLAILNRCKLFFGLKEQEILHALDCLNATVKGFGKNDFISYEGDEAGFAIILSGEVRTQSTDYEGNVNIISTLCPSDAVAASASYSASRRLPFDLVCAKDCEILRLDASKLISPCGRVCPSHARLIENMLGIISDRNVMLALKIDILTKRNIKDKVLAYLYAQSKSRQSPSFCVPLSRRQMAEYLSINRSALSRVLCTLRDEGYIEFEGNKFCLKRLKD